MNELDTLSKFRADVPSRGEAARSQARDALSAAITAAAPPAPQPRTDRAARLRRRVAVAALGALIVAGGSWYAATTHARGSGAPLTHATTLTLSGVPIKLAAYTFKTPQDYRPALTYACPSAPGESSGAEPVPVLGGITSAIPQGGGCLFFALSAGGLYGPPASSQPIAVGSYAGFLFDGVDLVNGTVIAPGMTASSTTLFVMIPAASGSHYLVLSSTTLSDDDLVQVAASGLPSGQ
jgi:hypothetical protein